jgi:hypothetical protein
MTIDLLTTTRVVGVITQGRQDSSDQRYVTMYTVSASNDLITWQDVTSQLSGNLSFPGNSDKSTQVTRYFNRAHRARYIRIRPWARNSIEHLGLRAGLQVDPTCQDANECTTGTHACRAGVATCVNTIGSYSCSCNPGYSGVTCDRANECVLNTHNCDANAACTDTEPGFSCVCYNGYSSNGTSCSDMDECNLGTHNCGFGTTCENSDGGFMCPCASGYEWNGSLCADINECALGTHNCGDAAGNHKWCFNTMGSFTCPCMAGFSHDQV